MNSSFSVASLCSMIGFCLGIIAFVMAVTGKKKKKEKVCKTARTLSVISLIIFSITLVSEHGSDDIIAFAIIAIPLLLILLYTHSACKKCTREKDAAPATETQASIAPAAVEPKAEPVAAPQAETVAAAAETPAAVVAQEDENLRGNILYASVKDVSGILLTVTDEGFRYVGKALQHGSAKNEHVDEFVEYARIVEFKKTMGVFNIIANGYTFIIGVHKEDLKAIQYIYQRFLEEQRKPHIMRCNICGQIYTYTFAEMDEQLKKMKTATGSMVGATLTTLATSRLLGSVESGNAQAQINSAADKLDALSRCPNCRSKDATEITAEEAAAIRAAATAPAQAASSADELKKFKELLDIGAITQDEFDAKKKQLLGL